MLGSTDSEPDEDGNTVLIPNPEDVRASKYIYSSALKKLLENRLGVFVAAKLGRVQTDPEELLWVYLPQYGSASSRLSIDYKTGADSANPESYYYINPAPGQPGAGAWAKRAGTMAYKIYAGETVRIVAQNCTARRVHPPKEAVYPLRDYPDIETAEDALVGILEANSRAVRRYGPVIASPSRAPSPARRDPPNPGLPDGPRYHSRNRRLEHKGLGPRSRQSGPRADGIYPSGSEQVRCPRANWQRPSILRRASRGTSSCSASSRPCKRPSPRRTMKAEPST